MNGNVFFYPVTQASSDHAITEQINDGNQIEPVLGCPDIVDSIGKAVLEIVIFTQGVLEDNG